MFRTHLCIAFGLLVVLVAPSLCFAQAGTLERGTIASPALGGEDHPFVVYLPPSYTISEKEHPSFYVLHGAGQNEGALTGMGLTMDRMIQNGEIGEMIAIFVGGGSTGRYEISITKDLVDHVDAHYRTIPHRNSRGITGYSAGGYGAIHLALKFPEVFAVTVGQASPMYQLSEVERYLNQPVRLNGIKIVVGRGDTNAHTNNQNFDKELTGLGVDHEFVVHGGGHIFVPEESLQFLSDHLHPLHEIARLREGASATIAPGVTVVGEPTALEVAVTLDVPPEAIECLLGIFLDLSPLGIPSGLPLEHAGGGHYSLNRTITPSWNGRHKLPLIMETGFEWDIEGARYPLRSVELDVYLATDEYYFYQDAMGSGWAVNVYKGELDLEASEVVHRGSYAQTVTLQSGGYIKYTSEDPDGFSTFGYTNLGFWINPGTSSTERAVLSLLTAEGGKTIKLTIKFREDLGITFAPDIWQRVSIPLEELGLVDAYLKNIWFQAGEGTFYLDDLALEVAEYRLEAAAAGPERIKADGTMSTILTVQVTPSVLEPGAPPAVTVDLTPIGGEQDAVMADDGTGGDEVPGDGIYTLRTTVDPGIGNGRKDLVITSRDRHLRGVRTYLEVGVLPAEDVYLYQDEVEGEWTLTLYKAESNPKSTEYVHRGTYAHAVTLQPRGEANYTVEDPDGLPTFGYATLEFWVNPGNASIEELKVIASRWYVGEMTRRKVLSLVEQWGLSFESETWQLVSIPVEALELTDANLEYIRLTGDVQGTFYIDDMRLILEEVTEPSVPTAVEVSEGRVAPSGYSLSQNYPNPFNPETTIRYDLPAPGATRLFLYNLSGQLIRKLVDEEQLAGRYSVVWDGTDETGRAVASGVYLCRMEVGEYRAVRKMLLTR